MTNTRKLKALFVEHGLTQAKVADYLGITAVALNRKINNKVEFRQNEISKLTKLLSISNIGEIFFDEKVS